MMPVARVQLPDGRVARVEVPDGTTPEQALAFAKQAAGGQAPPAKAKPKPSFFEQARDSTVNALAGVVQGAAAIPDAATEAVAGAMRYGAQGVGMAGNALLRAAGADNAADSLQRSVAMADRAWAQPVTVGRAVEAAAPTKPGFGASRMAANLVGGMLVPIGPKAAPRQVKAANAMAPTTKAAERQVGREVVQQGKQAGIRVMTSDVRPPRGFTGKGIRALGERVPLIGTGGVRQKQQLERIAAVKQVASDYGADIDGPAIDAVAASLAAKRGADLTRLSAIKTSVIDGIEGNVPTDRTVSAINDQIARLNGINEKAFAPVTAKLRDFAEVLMSGKSLSQIEGNRRLLGDLFADPSLASIRGDGQKALNAIYDPLRAEMGTFIRNRAGAGTFARWSKANEQLAGMAGELKTGALKSVLNDAEAIPENVGKLLFSAKPSEVRRLYSNLPAPGRAKAQAAILQRAFQKAGGGDNLSPDKFAGEIKRLGDSVGVFFQQGDMARINGLTRVLDYTKRAAEAGVMTNSGQQAVPFAIGAVAMAHPWLVGGGALLARAYESAPVRNALLRLGRTKAGSPQEAVQLNRVAGMIAPLVERGKAAINDNVPLRASAGEGPEQQQQQQAAPQP